MSSRRKKAEGAAPPGAKAPRPRSARNRQRQRLIDACISALHIHGPSRTTVEKVVAIAKMSPGIVRFYFDSKAAMLVASLQFLSAEFEEQVLRPVSRLRSDPVAALELLVDLYLDPDIASPRKVSVWYAFWGEASSRQEYYDICGQKDESFAALVLELIGRLIEETRQPQLDPGGIALGLIGVLEMLWQDFAFRAENDIDRDAAKRRCMAYLKSIFPGQFAAPRPRRGSLPGPVGAGRLAGWAYGSVHAHLLERRSLFHAAWQAAAHQSQLPHAGDFMTADLGAERVLLVRDGFGAVRALRNCCPRAPHVLTMQRSGRFTSAIGCKVHSLQFGLDGRRTKGEAGADLETLDLEMAGGLVMVRSPGSSSPPAFEGWFAGIASTDAAADASPPDLLVRADWKLLIEQWLEFLDTLGSAKPSSDSIDWLIEPGAGWSGARYRKLAAPRSSEPWLQRFVAPDLWLQRRPDGIRVVQVVAAGPAECRVRRIELATRPREKASGALQYLAARAIPLARRSTLATAESAQHGVSDFGYRAGDSPSVALAWFRRYLATRIPALAAELPPSDLR